MDHNKVQNEENNEQVAIPWRVHGRPAVDVPDIGWGRTKGSVSNSLSALPCSLESPDKEIGKGPDRDRGSVNFRFGTLVARMILRKTRMIAPTATNIKPNAELRRQLEKAP